MIYSILYDFDIANFNKTLLSESNEFKLYIKFCKEL